ncbi:VOC family protein [Stakelama marina]|uniref:VOC family protein n=1 Tax=Stakelama marina TaxID=2826939 RepID=A0A8T4IKL1_9SPHN|nr:VOC family protein [Stakelama marina]MBR0552899.1 VOC family protein [Stakelama marina]
MADEAQGPASGVTPHLTIRDGRGAEAVEFYKHAFGAEEVARNLAEDGTRLMHSHLRINGSSVMLNDDFPEYSGKPAGEPAAMTLHLQVDDADRWFDRAVGAGATVGMELADQFWGDRYGQIRDPFGFCWSIGGPIRKG